MEPLSRSVRRRHGNGGRCDTAELGRFPCVLSILWVGELAFVRPISAFFLRTRA